MTTCLQGNHHDRSGYYFLEPDDEGTEIEQVQPTARRVPPTMGRPRRGVLDKWLYPDPLTELLDELRLTGRRREAAAVERVLGLDDDEEAMRAYVSMQWSDDWNSPEDATYDLM